MSIEVEPARTRAVETIKMLRETVRSQDKTVDALYRRLDQLNKDHNKLWGLLVKHGIDPEDIT